MNCRECSEVGAGGVGSYREGAGLRGASARQALLAELKIENCELKIGPKNIFFGVRLGSDG